MSKYRASVTLRKNLIARIFSGFTPITESDMYETAQRISSEMGGRYIAHAPMGENQIDVIFERPD
tara:strand:- start:223 stop:417 length:195 start_codon:yes stop_codon:yes gene_type:complete